jgi:MOSC domain-containing protein YiiM
MDGLVLEGKVVAVAADQAHRFRKGAQRRIVLSEGQGVVGHAHAGAFVRHRYLARRRPRLPNLRQVHLIPSELFETLRRAGYDVHPGDLGENITTAGLDLERMPLGTRMRLGPTATVELTGLRTPCVLIDRFRKGLRKKMIGGAGEPAFRCGVMGVVAVGGEIVPGVAAQACLPPRPWSSLPAL